MSGVDLVRAVTAEYSAQDVDDLGEATLTDAFAQEEASASAPAPRNYSARYDFEAEGPTGRHEKREQARASAPARPAAPAKTRHLSLPEPEPVLPAQPEPAAPAQPGPTTRAKPEMAKLAKTDLAAPPLQQPPARRTSPLLWLSLAALFALIALLLWWLAA